MVTKNEFLELVSSAYQSLYDFVRLRGHPLTRLVLADEGAGMKERGWQMHRLLLDAIEQLYPGPTAPPFSKEWRRHRLMVLRYVESLDPQAVADQLAVSRRQYYREHTIALEAVADILWARCEQAALVGAPSGSFGEEDSAPLASLDAAQEAEGDWLPGAPVNVMQRELARISQNDPYANLPEVVEGVLDVLGRVLDQHGIAVRVSLPPEIPVVSVGHHLLRQVMLAALGYLAENTSPASLSISAEQDDAAVTVRLIAEGMARRPEAAANREHLQSLREMVQLGSITLDLVEDEPTADGYAQPGFGFLLSLPLEYDWTVLAVDDNEDTLALYKRCLMPNRYRVMVTSSPGSALEMARQVQPDAIILDLMMPEHDGWDLLQQLTNQPDTAHIPIMICSVLKLRDLALSLGARAYLAKPFTEQGLFSTLESLLRAARRG